MKIRKYLDIIQNNIVLKILRHFVLFTGDYTGRHVALIIKENPKTTRKYLDGLYNQSILDRQIAGKSYLYSLRDNYFTKSILIPLITDEDKLYGKVLAELETLLINNKCTAAAIYGSYARREEADDSDLDLFILVKKKNDKLESALDDMARSMLDKYSLELAPHIIEESEWEAKKDMQVIKDIYQTGQWLFGQTEAIKWLRKKK